MTLRSKILSRFNAFAALVAVCAGPAFAEGVSIVAYKRPLLSVVATDGTPVKKVKKEDLPPASTAKPVPVSEVSADAKYVAIKTGGETLWLVAREVSLDGMEMTQPKVKCTEVAQRNRSDDAGQGGTMMGLGCQAGTGDSGDK